MVVATARRAASSYNKVEEHEGEDSVQRLSWTPRVIVDCVDLDHPERGTKYLKQETLRALLDQVEEDETFSLKSLTLSKHLGTAEFYLVLKWMRGLGLVTKVQGGYVIASVEAVRRAWNHMVLDAVKL